MYEYFLILASHWKGLTGQEQVADQSVEDSTYLTTSASRTPFLPCPGAAHRSMHDQPTIAPVPTPFSSPFAVS